MALCSHLTAPGARHAFAQAGPRGPRRRGGEEESPRRVGRRQGLSPILSPTLTLSRYWDKISSDAKDFVGKLLVVDPKQRMDCRAALKHRWLVSEQAAH